jgi:hypothetical protein
MERVRPWTASATSEDEVRRCIVGLLELVEEGAPALASYDARVGVGERLLRMAREVLPPESWRFETDPLLR